MSQHSRHSHHARRALAQARGLAQRYHHAHIETGHLLVGIMRTDGSIGSQVLRAMQLHAAQAEPLLLTLDPAATQLRAEAALETSLQWAAEEARSQARPYIGTEHLLLAITQLKAGSAPLMLRRLGSSPEQLRQQLYAALEDGATEFDLQTAKQIVQLSELSRRVINAAEQRALAMGHERVGLGHLLLELAQETRSPTAQMLYDCGLDDARLRQDLAQASPALLVAVELMLAQLIELMGQLGSHYIGTEHLLRVLVADPAGSATLRAYGVDPGVLLQRLNTK